MVYYIVFYCIVTAIKKQCNKTINFFYYSIFLMLRLRVYSSVFTAHFKCNDLYLGNLLWVNTHSTFWLIFLHILFPKQGQCGASTFCSMSRIRMCSVLYGLYKYMSHRDVLHLPSVPLNVKNTQSSWSPVTVFMCWMGTHLWGLLLGLRLPPASHSSVKCGSEKTVRGRGEDTIKQWRERKKKGA